MGKYLRLLRVRHYVKNSLIFIPLFFNRDIFNANLLVNCIFGLICFSLLSSMVYIFNDIQDVELDKLHSQKNKRPLACGEITAKEAYVAFVVLFVIVAIICYFVFFENIYSILIMASYLAINILYSIKLKHIPIIDITILASGFFLRLLFGSVITSIDISSWMYLTVICLSFYFALGKRRNELSGEGFGTRPLLREYSYNFLDKFMYLYLALTIVFYSLWVISIQQVLQRNILQFTIPLVMVTCMRYSLIVEGASSGDPVEVILSDNILKVLSVLLMAIFASGLYVFV